MQSQSTPQIRLKRIAPGEYETQDGRWSISRRRASEDYGGHEEWFARKTRHAYHAAALDPVPTLREVRHALAATYAVDDLAGRECPDCGSQLKRDWRCPGCGAEWDELAEEEEAEESGE